MRATASGTGRVLVDGLKELGDRDFALAMDEIEDHSIDLGVGLGGHLFA